MLYPGQQISPAELCRLFAVHAARDAVCLGRQTLVKDVARGAFASVVRYQSQAHEVRASACVPVPSSLGLYNEAQFERRLREDIADAHSHVVIFSGYVTEARVKRLAQILKPKIMDGVKVRCVTRPPRSNGTIPEASGRAAIDLLESIGAVVDCRSRVHQKLCLIDAQIVWLGSLNALSHMYMADEMMTRIVDSGLAGVLAAHMCKRRCSPERAVAAIAVRENRHCPACAGRTVLHDRLEAPALRCEADCGWTGRAW